MAAKSMDEIAALLKGVKLRKRLFGVDEKHVWQVMRKLQEEYRAVFDAHEERSKALLEEREERIRELEAKLSAHGEKL